MFALYSVGNFENFAIVLVLLNLGLNGTCLIFGVNVRSRHRDMRYNKKVRLRLLHSIAQNWVKCQFLDGDFIFKVVGVINVVPP